MVSGDGGHDRASNSLIWPPKSSHPNPAWQSLVKREYKSADRRYHSSSSTGQSEVTRGQLCYCYSPVFSFIRLERRCVVWEINGVTLPLSLTPFTLKPHACTPLSLLHLISLWKPSLMINPRLHGGLLCFFLPGLSTLQQKCSRQVRVFHLYRRLSGHFIGYKLNLINQRK